ncbi:MAG: hypothetical protein AAGB25_03330 [Pseudomonadota bacterium]
MRGFATVLAAAALAGCSTVDGVGKDISAAATGLENALFGPTVVEPSETGESPREDFGGQGPGCNPYSDLFGGPENDLYRGLPPCK